MEERKEIVEEQDNQNPLQKVFFSKSSSIVRKRCPVCNSKHRQQVDAMLEKGEPHEAIRKFLEENGELVPAQKIKYHAESHFRTAATDVALEEYAANMGEMVKRRRSPVDDVEHLIGSAWMEYGRIAVLPTNGDFHKEFQRQKMLKEAGAQILEAQEFLRNLQGSAQVREMEEAFEKAWMDRLEAAKTDEEKDLIIQLLKDIKQRMVQQKAKR